MTEVSSMFGNSDQSINSFSDLNQETAISSIGCNSCFFTGVRIAITQNSPTIIGERCDCSVNISYDEDLDSLISNINSSNIYKIYFRDYQNPNFLKKILPEAIFKFSNKIVSNSLGKNYFLFLHGSNTGTGKTLAASYIGIKSLEKGQSVFFLNVGELLDKLKNINNIVSYESKEIRKILGENWVRLIHYAQNVEVLILDEIAMGKNLNRAQEEILYHIINTRYCSERVTIFTSNNSLCSKNSLDKKDIFQSLGNRIASRVNVSNFIEFKDVDHRRVQKQFNDDDILNFSVSDKLLSLPKNESSLFNWMVRNPVFINISNIVRKKLTVTVEGKAFDKDREIPTMFKGVWLKDDIISISGPICDHDDKQLYMVVIRELINNHKRKEYGLTVKISKRQLAYLFLEKIGKKKPVINGSTLNMIDRRLSRLKRMGLEYRNTTSNSFWLGSLIDEIESVNAGRNSYVAIRLNPRAISFFNSEELTILDLEKTSKLSGDSNAIHCFVQSHSRVNSKDKSKTNKYETIYIGDNQLYNILGIDDNLASNSKLKRKRRLVKELKDKDNSFQIDIGDGYLIVDRK